MPDRKFSPISMSDMMMRRILAHQKWATRRVIVPQPGTAAEAVACKYKPGDILYPRETHFVKPDGVVLYSSNFYDQNRPNHSWAAGRRMHAEHARAWLEVDSVEVQQLGEMKAYDYIREGFGYNDAGRWVGILKARIDFVNYWDSLNAARGLPYHPACFVFVINWRDIYRQPPAGWNEYLAGILERREKRKRKKAGI